MKNCGVQEWVGRAEVMPGMLGAAPGWELAPGFCWGCWELAPGFQPLHHLSAVS